MSQDPKLQPRYSGIPTFMRTPFVPDLEGLDIALVGVPFDGGVTNRTGARHGPREVRNQSSLMRTINQATGIAPFELVNVGDGGDAVPDSPFELLAAHASIEAFFRDIKAAGVMPIAAGGDHSITLPILRALGAARMARWRWSILMPTATPVISIWVHASTTARRSRWPPKRG